jgi:archaellum component FlaC
MYCAHCGAGKAKAMGSQPLDKGGRCEVKGTGKGSTPAAHREKNKKGEQPSSRGKAGTAATDAATVAAVYKELTALRAECKELRKLRDLKAAGTPTGPPAARAKSAEPGAGDAEVKSKKKRMDELRDQIEHLEKAGDGLGDILAARRAELERLRGEVRAAHPLDVQIRNLDSKLGAVRKQREKLESEAKTTAELILELKVSLDKTAKAAAEKRAEEDQLAIERVELVAKQAAAAAPGGDVNTSPGDDTIPEQLRGMGLEGLDPGLRAGLRAFFAKKAATGTGPPAPAAAPAAPAGPEAAATAAAAAAAEILGRGAGGDATMSEGSEKEEEEASKRRRLGRTAA